MEINKLSELEVKHAKPRTTEYRLSDGGGLYLVVKPSGGKLWRWSYEFKSKEKLLSYGPYPALTLAMAREEHEKARALKRQWIDPAAEKQARKHAEVERERESSLLTFAALTEEWLNTWSRKKSARYVETVKTRLDRDILPAVCNVPIDQLKATVLIKIVSGIQNGRDAEDLARRALQKMKQILRYAVAKGYIKSSPISDTRPADFLRSHTVKNFAGLMPRICPNSSKESRLIVASRSASSAARMLSATSAEIWICVIDSPNISASFDSGK